MKSIEVITIGFLVLASIIAFYPMNPQNTLLNEYQLYLKKFGKTIATKEQLFYRSQLFNQFLFLMNEHNSNPKHTWKMGINQFSDLTRQQFVSTFLGEKQLSQQQMSIEQVNAGFTSEIDWRTRGIITPVKNQGQCGSCWAFAATAAHESYQIQRLYRDKNIDLSEQQLVDCSKDQPYKNQGCNGGYAVQALLYIQKFGQTTEKRYPYMAVNQDCRISNGSYLIDGIVQITGCSLVESQIQRNPFAVRVDATNWSAYHSGILDDCQKNINHAVFMVGSNQQSWTIKNSWGPYWGENGYIRLAKGDTCAVCQGISYPK